MVNDITSEDAKGSIGNHVGNGLVHALFQADGRIALVVAVGAGRVLGVARRIVLGVGSAADGLGALRVGSRHVSLVDVNVGEVHDLQRSLAARRRSAASRLGGREGNIPLGDVRDAAEAEEGGAEELGRLGVEAHVAKSLSDDGALQSNSSVADIIILHLG